MRRFILLIYLFVSVPLYANQLLDKYIKAALKNSFLLKSAYYNTMVKNYNYKSLTSQKLPQIKISSEIDKLNYDKFNYLNYSVNLILSLDLSKTFSSYSQSAFYLKKKSELEQQYVKQQIIFNIKKIYFEIYIKEQEKETIEKAISYINNHLKILKTFSSYGAKKYKLNLLRAQTEKANITIQLNGLKNKIEILKAKLKSLTGIKITNTNFSIPSRYTNFIVPEAKKNFLTLKILNFQKSAVASAVKAKKLYWLPELFVNTGYNIDNDPTGDGNNYEIKAGLGIPLFDFGAKKNEIKALQNRKEKIDYLLKETKRKIKLKYNSLKQKIVNCSNDYKILLNAEKKAVASLKLAKQEYKQGMVNEMDILDIYRKLIEVQISKNEILLEYLKNVAELEFITGE